MLLMPDRAFLISLKRAACFDPRIFRIGNVQRLPSILQALASLSDIWMSLLPALQAIVTRKKRQNQCQCCRREFYCQYVFGFVMLSSSHFFAKIRFVVWSVQVVNGYCAYDNSECPTTITGDNGNSKRIPHHANN